MRTIIVLLMCAACNLALADVDAELVGTWRLDYPGPPIYWVVGKNDNYRLHGPQTAASSHRGAFQAAKGKWSLNSPQWQDEGTYTITGNTWTAVGKLGPGTWKRVATTSADQPNPPSGTSACSLLTPNEAASVLDAPASKGSQQGAAHEGCRYASTLNNQERLSIFMRHGKTSQDAFKTERDRASSPIDIPGVGLEAYATVASNGVLQMDILGKESWDASRNANMATRFELRLKLVPAATRADIPALEPIARKIVERWKGKAPLGAEKPAEDKEEGGFSLPSLLGFGTPLPPRELGACLLTAAEIQNHLSAPFGEGAPYGKPNLDAAHKKALCKYPQLQGYGGEIEISFSSMSSTRRTWTRQKNKPESYNRVYVSGVGDDAYVSIVEVGIEIRVAALYGNSEVWVKWKGNSQWGTGPTEGSQAQLLELLKIAGGRLH